MIGPRFLLHVLALVASVELLKGDKPNIIIILADDMGYSDIGCYGSEIETPHLDRLSRDGVRFTQFYNAARCCPSRASILTGLYPHQAGMGEMTLDFGVPAYRGKILNHATTIAEVLSGGGYETFMVGKWHLGEDREVWPDRYGFDRYYSFLQGASNYFNLKPWNSGGQAMRIVEAGRDIEAGSGFYMTDAFTDKAVEFIEERNSDQPFFMYLAYTAPHWPLHALPEDIAKYKGRYLEGWDEIRKNRFARMQEMGIIRKDFELPSRNREVGPWSSVEEADREEWDTKMAIYAAMIDRMDQGIGLVLEALEGQGALERTVIFFLADNGGCHEELPWGSITAPLDGEPGSENTFMSYDRPWANVSNTPFDWYKSYNHEGGIATPLVAFGPCIVDADTKGSIESKRLGHIVDLLPTCLDLAELRYPVRIGEREITPTPGRSLMPSLKGREENPHEALYWEHMTSRAIRSGDWKLVANGKAEWVEGEPIWELYHLKDDPFERRNLAGNYPERVMAMTKQYNDWAEETGVLAPLEFFELRKVAKDNLNAAH
ncbi:MAG: arylsulfatase [Verrucomicrobiota bacterium]